MALEVGSRLGHYDVTALIGEGGMGQVYQATDTKLNRQVALKILPEAFASVPDRLARFQREAQVLASLNHPNIAAIHGLEDSEGRERWCCRSWRSSVNRATDWPRHSRRRNGPWEKCQGTQHTGVEALGPAAALPIAASTDAVNWAALKGLAKSGTPRIRARSGFDGVAPDTYRVRAVTSCRNSVRASRMRLMLGPRAAFSLSLG